MKPLSLAARKLKPFITASDHGGARDVMHTMVMGKYAGFTDWELYHHSCDPLQKPFTLENVY